MLLNYDYWKNGGTAEGLVRAPIGTPMPTGIIKDGIVYLWEQRLSND